MIAVRSQAWNVHDTPTAPTLSKAKGYAEDKAIANLCARFALAGHEMRVVSNADGRIFYQVGRWGQFRHFTHVHDAEAFLTQICGREIAL